MLKSLIHKKLLLVSHDRNYGRNVHLSCSHDMFVYSKSSSRLVLHCAIYKVWC